MVSELLIEEAKTKFPIGVKINCLHNQKDHSYIDTDNFEGNIYCIRHRNKQGYVCCVYQRGVWAEIIQQEVEIEIW